jgi:glycine/D-amino acid oxidase-like deaminating enzyme
MHVVIIGCGVIGAAIAYELSQVQDLKVTVIDKHLPAQEASTKAALGVLMGIISHKIKGRAWLMRQTSIQRYETWIPELEALTGRTIPFNRQGILSLCFAQENLTEWERLAEIRHSQGFSLEIWDTVKLKKLCPQIDNKKVISAIYSPSDRQIDPTALTLALVDAARQYGVTFSFGVEVLGITPSPADRTGVEEGRLCHQVETSAGKISADWFVVAAGLGSSRLLQSLSDVSTDVADPSNAKLQLQQRVDIRPVLGQALHLRLGHYLGNSNFQPVITGDDVHIVPVNNGDYWVGATVEFPLNGQEIQPNEELLESVKQQAVTYCPDLANATTIRTWSGLRPRPEGRPAPIIGKMSGFNNVFLATGHYRNGVLLAPATASAIREMIISNNS